MPVLIAAHVVGPIAQDRSMSDDGVLPPSAILAPRALARCNVIGCEWSRMTWSTACETRSMCDISPGSQ